MLPRTYISVGRECLFVFGRERVLQEYDETDDHFDSMRKVLMVINKECFRFIKPCLQCIRSKFQHGLNF